MTDDEKGGGGIEPNKRGRQPAQGGVIRGIRLCGKKEKKKSCCRSTLRTIIAGFGKFSEAKHNHKKGGRGGRRGFEEHVMRKASRRQGRKKSSEDHGLRNQHPPKKDSTPKGNVLEPVSRWPVRGGREVPVHQEGRSGEAGVATVIAVDEEKPDQRQMRRSSRGRNLLPFSPGEKVHPILGRGGPPSRHERWIGHRRTAPKENSPSRTGKKKKKRSLCQKKRKKAAKPIGDSKKGRDKKSDPRGN